MSLNRSEVRRFRSEHLFEPAALCTRDAQRATPRAKNAGRFFFLHIFFCKKAAASKRACFTCSCANRPRSPHPPPPPPLPFPSLCLFCLTPLPRSSGPSSRAPPSTSSRSLRTPRSTLAWPRGPATRPTTVPSQGRGVGRRPRRGTLRPCPLSQGLRADSPFRGGVGWTGDQGPPFWDLNVVTVPACVPVLFFHACVR